MKNPSQIGLLYGLVLTTILPSHCHSFNFSTLFEEIGCYNLPFRLGNLQILEDKCTSFWTERNCKGYDLTWSTKSGPVTSVSGCSRCTTNNGLAGLRCRTRTSKHCLPLGHVCDGKSDCLYGDDERSCGHLRPQNFQCVWRNRSKSYKCENATLCVSPRNVCDGRKECPNGDDERNCELVRSINCGMGGASERRCEEKPNSLECMLFSKVCDGREEESCKGDSCGGEEEKPLGADEEKPPGVDVPATIRYLDLSKFQVYDPDNNATKAARDPPHIDYIAYRRSQPNDGFFGNTLNFGRNEKVAFYIHGFATEYLTDGEKIKDAFFEGTDDIDTVVLVDWRDYSSPESGNDPFATFNNYPTVANKNVPIVAANLTRFMEWKLERENYIYLIGYSLGGHISGTAARNTRKFRIRRISALDPAGPIFEYGAGFYDVNMTNTLRVTDANFVDVIHASDWLGMHNAAGHLDTYLFEDSCGIFQPSCKHHRAVEQYIASLNRCSLITCPPTGDCTHQTISDYGYLSDKYGGRGRHDLNLLTSTDPNGWKDHMCNSYKNLYLPAKYRVCKNAPHSDEDSRRCTGKPYLSECRVHCPEQNKYVKSVCSSSWELQLGPQSQTSSPSPSIHADAINTVQWQFGNERCSTRQDDSRLQDSPKALPSCKNEDGQDVDFFIVYKPPQSLEYNVLFRTGGLQRGKYLITSKTSVFGETFQQVLDTSVRYVVWNDEDINDKSNLTERANGDYGYSKGVLAFKNEGGFLMIHSFPGYPTSPTFEFPAERRFEDHVHMAICVTLHHGNDEEFLPTLEKLVDGMRTFRPYIRNISMGDYYYQRLQIKVRNLNGNWREPKQRLMTDFQVTNDFRVHIFGRRVNKKDLGYDVFDYLAKHYHTDLKVKSWTGGGRVSRNCTDTFKVENIVVVKVAGFPAWTQDQDHSKWVVGRAASVVCIGDLDRQLEAMYKGGMFLCLENLEIHEIFSEFPKQVDPCVGHNTSYLLFSRAGHNDRIFQ